MTLIFLKLSFDRGLILLHSICISTFINYVMIFCDKNEYKDLLRLDPRLLFLKVVFEVFTVKVKTTINKNNVYDFYDFTFFVYGILE